MSPRRDFVLADLLTRRMTVRVKRGRPASEPKRYGTFAGVFTPTLLTILGVIMYLRLGWTVGNAGLVGALLIILVANGITLATGLSLSSIATNTRLGAGGPYAIISKSLGFEVGGSVGLPLYFSQALVVSMYVIGFREGWNWIFPHHSPLLVDLAVFGVVLVIAYISAGLAFRIQYVVIGIIALSIVLILASPAAWRSQVPVTLFGRYSGAAETGFSGTSFWPVFAVFFPAVTGILAGANMSGELKNPRRSIPLGTLAAIGISAAIYVALAIWCSRVATSDELIRNYTIMLDRSLWAPGVLAGLLGATFSSALSSLVGAPRILRALGTDRLVPAGGWLSAVSGGEPRRAMLVTGVIVLLGLMTRDLNAIAPLISMFFLITYAVINIVLLAESSLQLMSFRPTLPLPRIVPLLGAVGCTFAMFIVNPTFSLIAVTVVAGLYVWLLWRGTTPRTGTVRSGIFVAFAEWAAGKVIELEMSASRAWKPNLLVPVQDSASLRGEFRLLVDLCRPEGSIKILGLATAATVNDLAPRVSELTRALRKNGVMTTASTVDSAGYLAGIVTGLQALGSAFFRPNVLFLRLPADVARFEELDQVIREAGRLGVGVILLALHDRAGYGRSKVVNLWIPPKEPRMEMSEYLARNDLNLAILTALRLARSWQAELNLISVVENDGATAGARHHIEELRDLCRVPDGAVTRVMVGEFEASVARAPQSDMDLMGMSRARDMAFVANMVRATRSSCLFAGDSGQESALA